MVRAVLMNIFYKTDLQIRDPESEFWAKMKKGGQQNMRNQIEVQNRVSEGIYKTGMTFEHILEPS